MLPARQGHGLQIGVGNLPDIVGFASLGGEAEAGFALGEGINLGTCLAVESSAVEVALADVGRQIKPAGEGIGLGLAHLLSLAVFVHLNVGHIEALRVGKPNLAVGIGGLDCDFSRSFSTLNTRIVLVTAIEGITIIVGTVNILFADLMGAVVQCLGIIHRVILLGGQDLSLIRGVHDRTAGIDGLAICIHQIVMNKNGTTVGRNLRNVEILAGLLILIVQQAGATELVVHGRTKEQGYRAEHIDWQAIGEIRQRLNIPVIANGEIWDWQSAQQWMAISGCDAVMIGRGALNIPNLSRVVKYNEPRMPWPEVVALLQKYTRLEKQGDTGLYHVARIKQWLSYLRKEYDEATELFQHVRVLNNSPDIARAIQAIDIDKLR